MLPLQCPMAPDEVVTMTCHAKTSALHPQDSGGSNKLSHTRVLHLSAVPVGEAPALLPSSSSDDDDDIFLPTVAPVHDVRLTARSSERQRKVENFENFPPRRPLKLAPIELPLEVKKAQRQKLHSIWNEAENLERQKVSSHAKALLLPVSQIMVGQRFVKKDLDYQMLKGKLAIHSSLDLFQTHQNTTCTQSGHGKVNIGQSEVHKAGCSKRRSRQLDEDQSKSGSSTEGLKDDEGKLRASGATMCQGEMKKVLEKSSRRNPVRELSEAAVGRGIRRMAVYSIQEAAL